MVRRRFQLIAILLAAASVGELAMSVLALGHRHTCSVHPVFMEAAISETTSECSHHHGHAHDAKEEQQSTSLTHRGSHDSESKHSSEDSCSICRYLAQPVLSAPRIVENFHQPLVEVVVSETTFDVAAPAHLIPQPRSPPVAA